ncbi:unnamed protein product [Durusdinium trenchii]|uniref:mTERF domain-containing protein 1, mitochondrial n=1 Tax=Durusdinium trenchii TaxID=1381693 RepID=A0ABP0HW52_9DINO
MPLARHVRNPRWPLLLALFVLTLVASRSSVSRSSVPPGWWRQGWPKTRRDSVAEAQLLAPLAELLMPKTPIEELFRSFPSPDGWGGHYLEPDLTAYGVLKDPNAALFVEYDGYWRHGEREGRTRDQSKNEALFAYGPPGSCVLRISHNHSRVLKDQLVGIQVSTWQTCCRASLERTLTDVFKKTSEGLNKVLCPRLAKRLDLEASRGSLRVSARTDRFVQMALAVKGGNTSEQISDYLGAEGFRKKEIELMIERASLSGTSIERALQPRIKWLLSIGLKHAEVVKAIATFPHLLVYSIEKNLKPTVQWFLDIGLSQAQVVKLIARVPQSLGYSIEENLKPTVQWFLDIGLSQAQVVKVIAGFPQSLGLSIEENLKPTVQWFLDIGLSQAQVVKNLKPTVQWFLDIGLSQAQVVKVIAGFPQSLGYSIEENLKPTVQWFLDFGLSQAQVVKAIASFPSLLRYSINDKLRPTAQWFLDMGLSQDQVVKVIAVKPNLLGYGIEKKLKPTVQWFLDIGLSQAQVVKVIAGCPQLLGYSIEENLKPTVQWFFDMGLSMDQVVNVVANYPSTLGAGVEKNLKPVRQWLLDLGLSEDQVVDVVTSFPIIMKLRLEQNLKPKQALLEDAFGRSEAATFISNDPRIFSYSYQRLATRLTVLVERHETHLLSSATRLTEAEFAKRFPRKPN